MDYIDIPYDLYESKQEVVLVVPLGGVQKSSLQLSIKEYRLYLTATRKKPNLRQDLHALEEQCYRGVINTVIDLPPSVYMHNISSSLSKENILTVILPKKIENKDITLDIQYE